MTSSESIGDILIQGIKKIGLDVGIISGINNENYKIIVSVVNDYVTKPDDDYQIKTGNEFKLAETYCSDVIRENKTKHYMDVENFTSMLKHPCYLSHQLRAYIGTPLRINGVQFGTLNYSSLNPRKNNFTQSEIEFVENQARLVAEILQRQL